MCRTALVICNVLILVVITALPLGAASSGPLRVASPDGRVEILFRLGAGQAPTYSVLFQGKTVVEDSSLALDFRQGGPWGAGQKIAAVRRNTHDETYPIVAGKSKQARDHYNQMVVAGGSTSKPSRRSPAA